MDSLCSSLENLDECIETINRVVGRSLDSKSVVSYHNIVTQENIFRMILHIRFENESQYNSRIHGVFERLRQEINFEYLKSKVQTDVGLEQAKKNVIIRQIDMFMNANDNNA